MNLTNIELCLLLYLLPAVASHYFFYYFERVDMKGNRIDTNENFELDTEYYITIIECYIPVYNLKFVILGVFLALALVITTLHDYLKPFLNKRIF